MKPPRTALPLPRYTLRKLLRSGVAHFFNVPTWARRAGCPVKNEPLGTDYEAAVRRVETVLLPAFDSWRTGGATDGAISSVATTGTLDWLFAEYRADRRFTKLDPRTKRNHESGMRLVGGYVMKDGRRLGQVRLSAITTAVADTLYEKLLTVTKTDAAGNVVERERRTTVNHAMKTCRRAWNVAARRNPGKLPLVNPFAQMGLRSSDRETPTATFAELRDFRAKAFELELAVARHCRVDRLGMAAARGRYLRHLRRDATTGPKERPNAVRVLHEKTREENWVPLFDDAGVPLYPELMAELDAIKRERIGGLMLCRDWGDRGPWPTTPKQGEIDLTHMSRKVKEIIRAAGLRDELSFTSFRHGGFTEAGDAELTDREIMAQGRHKIAKVLPRYVKRTMRQVATGAGKRRAARTDGGHLSE